MKKNILVTLADSNYIEQAKQLFSSVYWNSGWKGDYMLLSHGIPEEKLSWFEDKGIIVYRCKPLLSGTGTFGLKHHTATVFSKAYLFTEHFKQWKKVIYLDADIIVRASLDGLLSVKGFSAPSSSPNLLTDEFHKGDQGRLRDLKAFCPLDGPAFNTGMFAFDTKIITEGTFRSLNDLVERFWPASSFGEEGIFNLLWYKHWTKIPLVYNVYPEPVCGHFELSPNWLHAIALHFVTSKKPWDEASPYNSEWKDNLAKAEKIDLDARKEAVKIWTAEEIDRYMSFLRERRSNIMSRPVPFALFRGELAGLDRPAKRVLVISPTPTHPQNAGNRIRIFNLLNNIRSLGYKVHLVYDDLEYRSRHVKSKPDIKAMSLAWDGFVYVRRGRQRLAALIDTFNPGGLFLLNAIGNLPMILEGWLASSMGLVGSFLKEHSPRTYATVKPIFPDFPLHDDPRYEEGVKEPISTVPHRSSPHSLIDRWYNYNIDPVLDRIVSRRYDAVIVEYVFMSRSLEIFGPGTLKLIDTHDVFSGRKEKYEKLGIEHEFFSTTPAEESKGLSRADRIIAIQDRERAILQSLTDRPVYTLGHTVDIIPNSVRTARKRAVCVGAGSEANIHGVADLVADILPRVQVAVPGFELVLAGKVCDYVPDAPGCMKLGEIDDLRQAYDAADIAVNPVRVGTGLKIKSIEALGRGKPLVTTAIGAEGLEEAIGKGIFIAESPAEYAEFISRLISDPSLYQKAAEDAHQFAVTYNERAMRQLKAVLES